MYIRYGKETRGVEFGQLSVGELFAELDDDASVYIKIDTIETGEKNFNAILLSNGWACCFYPDSRIRPLEGELVLSDP